MYNIICNKYFFIFICFIFIVWLLIILIREISKSKKEKAEFISYLESIHDYTSLYQFGFYNKNNFHEGRRRPFVYFLIMEVYEKNKDERYLYYAQYAKKSSIKMIICIFSMYILFMIVMGIIKMA